MSVVAFMPTQYICVSAGEAVYTRVMVCMCVCDDVYTVVTVFMLVCGGVHIHVWWCAYTCVVVCMRRCVHVCVTACMHVWLVACDCQEAHGLLIFNSNFLVIHTCPLSQLVLSH